ncbi:MAG: class I SAM-dependent methyltransferase [Sedimentisphaerales bacterium]|nr:class I SAM-dependent methyltransferase [Sedimentisphaerales bacterium]
MKRMLRALWRPFRKGLDVERSWMESPAKFRDMVKFLSWFDKTSSIQETMDRAESDWGKLITAFDDYRQVPRRRCLEIGFGGGRLLVESSKDFEHALGVDIHNAFDKTREYIALAGRTNVTLLHKDELDTLEDASIDFIFSFIVFQHFHAHSEVDFYLGQIKRLMSPAGCAHIFFRRNETSGIKVVDPKDFRQRHSSLFIEPALFRERVRRDFRVLEYQDEMKKHLDQPESPQNVSGQARVVFVHKVRHVPSDRVEVGTEQPGERR